MSSAPATASAAPAYAASHGGHHQGPSLINTLVLGPYRFEWMVLTFPLRLVWALLGVVWGAVRHPIKTTKSVIGAIPTLVGAWIAMYIAVAVVSTARGDKNVLGTIHGPFVYAGRGLWALLADSWRTMDFFVGVLAHDLGAVTGLHGIMLLAFAMVLPHATIAIGIVAACQTMYWWCGGGVAGAIGTIIGTIAGLAAMAKFVPGMSLGSAGHSKPAGGGGHH